MHFKEVLGRLTGLSTPIFCVSWNPPEPEVLVARRVVTFLEDRRVLYQPSSMECPDHCVQSVLEIRRVLTSEPQSLDSDSDLAQALRAMRAACRKFLDRIGANEDLITFGGHRGRWASREFNGAIGELRGVFGMHLARLAAAHELDIEGEFARLLPGLDG